MPLFILSILVQLALVVHAIKTGRNSSWIFILLFFPLIGGLAYLIVELLPAMGQSRSGQRVRRNVSRTLNPDRHVREAAQNFSVASTAANALMLAEQLMEKQAYAEAAELLEHSMRGIHATDPELMLSLARARFGMRDYPGCLNSLDDLKHHNPQSTTADGHLLYARALEKAGKINEARAEYEALVGYYPGLEPACRLARLLAAGGDVAGSKALYQNVLETSRVSGRHYHQLHKRWIQMARDQV